MYTSLFILAYKRSSKANCCIYILYTVYNSCTTDKNKLKN